MKEQKTNVMRILDQKKVPYEARHYPHGAEAVDGLAVARALGEDPAGVFKTLVTRGSKGGYYVFVIPVAEELDLKKAARAVGEKSVSMLHVKELLPLTGYVRGGCTSIGMKKQFPTIVDVSAEAREKIVVSGGRLGSQLELKPGDLIRVARAKTADVVVE